MGYSEYSSGAYCRREIRFIRTVSYLGQQGDEMRVPAAAVCKGGGGIWDPNYCKEEAKLPTSMPVFRGYVRVSQYWLFATYLGPQLGRL